MSGKLKKLFKIAFLISIFVFILELIGLKYSCSFFKEINPFKLGLVLFSPMIGSILLLLLLYDKWFYSDLKGARIKAQKIFYYILTVCLIGIWVGIYAVFVF